MYLAEPDGASIGGILVLHSWWGLNGFFRSLCDRFANQGFTALAPDLYEGRVAATVAEAKELRAKVSASRKEPAYKYLIRMIGELQQATGDIAVVGFSMGGHWACWLAQRSELPITAAVTFYAARSGDYSASRSRFLSHFAETDDWVSPTSVKRLDRCLHQARREHRFYIYEGTGHWFFESDRKDAYRPAAATLAWNRTLEFLGASANKHVEQRGKTQST